MGDAGPPTVQSGGPCHPLDLSPKSLQSWEIRWICEESTGPERLGGEMPNGGQ